LINADVCLSILQDLNDDNRFIEFYNLVFMQYNRTDSGELVPLKITQAPVLGRARISQGELAGSFVQKERVLGEILVHTLLDADHLWDGSQEDRRRSRTLKGKFGCSRLVFNPCIEDFPRSFLQFLYMFFRI
jgi:hypothetical protein